jgi:DNA modification methylase
MNLPAPFYSDASCTIYNADCREILPSLGRFDLLLTDPPYGMNVDTDNSRLVVDLKAIWQSEGMELVLVPERL